MLRGLYSAASALTAAQRNQERTAHNLAHANVPGFRKMVASNATFEQAFGENTTHPVGSGTASNLSGTDFTSGPNMSTGRQLDVAISGDGFFAISSPEGTLYSRSGVFFLQDDGALVNVEGHGVQDANGSDIQLPTNIAPSDISIDENGAIAVSDTGVVAQLGLTAFEDNSTLERAGTTMFRASPDAVEIESTARIQQGARESSNVSTVDELIQMITGMRHYEAAQKILTSIDDTISHNTDPRVA